MADAEHGGVLDLASEEALGRIFSAARYALVGRVADSVTHDVNNLLGAGVAYSELVALEKNLSPESKRMLGEIVDSLLRGSALMNGLTALTRKETEQALPIDASKLAAETLHLAGHTLRRGGVTVESHLRPPDAVLVGDPPRLQVALLQLIMNAQEALEALPAGERVLRITTEVDEAGGAFHVWNSGPAVPESIRAEMFAPFFTTKGYPHLGVGLSAARVVAEQHDGALTYAPETGFTLYVAHFPAFARRLRELRRHGAS